MSPGPPAGGGARRARSEPPLGEQPLPPQRARPWGHLWAQLSVTQSRWLPCRWAGGWASLGLVQRPARAPTVCLLSSPVSLYSSTPVSLYPSLWLLVAPAGTSSRYLPLGLEPPRRPWEPISSSPFYRERPSLAGRTPPWGMSFPPAHVAPFKTPPVLIVALRTESCCLSPADEPCPSLCSPVLPPSPSVLRTMATGPTQLLIWALHSRCRALALPAAPSPASASQPPLSCQPQFLGHCLQKALCGPQAQCSHHSAELQRAGPGLSCSCLACRA